MITNLQVVKKLCNAYVIYVVLDNVRLNLRTYKFILCRPILS